MISSEQHLQKHPPDRPLTGKEGNSRDNGTILRTKEIGDSMTTFDKSLQGETEKEEGAKESIRGKMQRTAGNFSGGVSLMPREEDWMQDEHNEELKGNATPVSYREALKPTTEQERKQQQNRAKEDIWDGSLIGGDPLKWMEGISVIDTESGPKIDFTDEERRRLARNWQNSLIVKLLGGNIGYMQLWKKIQIMWAKSGRNIYLSEIGNGFMIATFQDREDYFFALEGGPWLVQNSYLTVQTWKSNFNPWNEKIHKVAVWVRLPGLPVDYYDRKFFYTLGNKIGTAIRVDEMTLTRARTMYARLCIEIDLNAPLLPSYSVDGNELKIEYEGLQLICFDCGKFGHNEKYCSNKEGEEEMLKAPENQKQDQVSNDKSRMGGAGKARETKYGEWMVAPGPKRSRRTSMKEGKGAEGSKKEAKATPRIETSSRYVALETEEEDVHIIEAEVGHRQPLLDASNLKGTKGEKLSIQPRQKGKSTVTEGKVKNQKIIEKSEKKENKGKVGETQKEQQGASKTEKTNMRLEGGKKEKGVSQKVEMKLEVKGVGQEKISKATEEREMGIVEDNMDTIVEESPIENNRNTVGSNMEEDSIEYFMDTTEASLGDSPAEHNKDRPPEDGEGSMEIDETKPPDPRDRMIMGLSDVEQSLNEEEQEDDEVQNGFLGCHVCKE